MMYGHVVTLSPAQLYSNVHAQDSSCHVVATMKGTLRWNFSVTFLEIRI